MTSPVTASSTQVPARESLDRRYTWDLSAIFPSWEAWEAAFAELDAGIQAYKKFEGTLAQGAAQLLNALEDRDALDKLSYRVWYYPALQYDEDQRNNTIDAKRQRAQLLLAKWQQNTSWFRPELLKLPLDSVREWMAASPELAIYRFAIEEVFRLQDLLCLDREVDGPDWRPGPRGEHGGGHALSRAAAFGRFGPPDGAAEARRRGLGAAGHGASGRRPPR